MNYIENTDADDTRVTFIGRTQDEHNTSISLSIPLELAKELNIENSKVLISLIYDYEGRKHLMVSKFHKEILID